MNLTYNIDIPATPNNPSNDQPKMKINTNSISNWVKVDHFGFGDNNGGYHTIIHQTSGNRIRNGNGKTFTNFPAAILNVNQFFTATYQADATNAANDTQLFSMTQGGGTNQMTGSQPATDGYVWLGGVMMQWGSVNFTGGPGFAQQSGNVVFKDRDGPKLCPPFPNNIFVVILTLHSTSGNTSNSQSLSYFDIDRTHFRWNYTGSSAYDRFNWVAIGN